MPKLHKWSELPRKLVGLERKRIKRALSRLGIRARLFHVGSTAVRGLGGKGIPDMLLVLGRKDLGKALEILEQLGYRENKKAGDRERVFMNIDRPYKSRKVHMHLHIMWTRKWKEMPAFAMLLRNDKKARKEYWELKKSLKGLPTPEYTRMKADFIREKTAEAVKRYGKLFNFLFYD